MAIPTGDALTYRDLRPELFASLLPGLYLLLVFVQTTIFVGIAGRRNDDEDREWWARWAGWTLILAVGVTALLSVTIFGPVLLGAVPALVTGLVGGISGVVTLLLGSSGVSPATPAQEDSVVTAGGWRKYVLRFAAPVFVVFLAMVAAQANSAIITAIAGARPAAGMERSEPPASLETAVLDRLLAEKLSPGAAQHVATLRIVRRQLELRV